jgi:diguanylate cyclase (GGDEF)-like protein
VERRRALEDQLRFQAFHDPLTGLANRRRFVDQVDRALATRTAPGSLAVLFLDLDDFKTVNDSMGHAAGDELLLVVGQRLRGATRAEDLAARIGGDEFGVLIEDLVDLGEAVEVASRIMSVLRDPITLGGQRVTVSISVGIATDQAAMTSADDLLRDADVAMYRAKAGGKDRFLVFGPAMGVADHGANEPAAAEPARARGALGHAGLEARGA